MRRRMLPLRDGRGWPDLPQLPPPDGDRARVRPAVVAVVGRVVQLQSLFQREGRAFARGAAKGFVQGVVTYTVLDDLTVTPMSAHLQHHPAGLLNAFAVTDLAALQETTVQLGYRGVRILKASLQSKTVLTDVAVQSAGKGFVQGIVTYTVTDNLTVTPMSAISSITLLNTLAVRDIGDLQERTVQLGYNEGLAILKASLQSKSVLTDVFLPPAAVQMATPTTLKMKLLIDAKAQRVVFAEADKDVVDFLFSLLALPVTTIVKMLGKEFMIGSLGNLYSSVENLDDNYILPGAEKNALLQPTVVPSVASSSRSSILVPAQPKSFFKCIHPQNSHCHRYVTDRKGTKCPNCSKQMSAELAFVSSGAADSEQALQKSSSSSYYVGLGEAPVALAPSKGFVQEVVTYMVRDDLTVSPMSTISSITVLNALAVTDFAALQEKTVRLGYTEVILRSDAHCQWEWRFSGHRCSPRPSSLTFSSSTSVPWADGFAESGAAAAS
ncbi:hypothetical protein U9M48_020805 [Paspalum notatum var. saurae]|uniref:Uncharacterized protein n=1 Tax=Paspalum notatum var. saurae TaxID=547442 RepID=A0AAQ3WST8_PASNO